MNYRLDVPIIDVDPPTPGHPPRRGLVIAIALFTLIAFGGGGIWIIVGVQHRSLAEVLFGNTPVWAHMLSGLAMGLLIAAVGWWIIARPYMSKVRGKYVAIIGPMMPSVWIQWFISVCAGVGEELFFRGALQQWFGVPLTAIGFVALHGYLDPRDRRICSYGIFLVLAMIGLGLYTNAYGLLGPIIAHTVIDIMLLGRLVGEWRRGTLQ